MQKIDLNKTYVNCPFTEKKPQGLVGLTADFADKIRQDKENMPQRIYELCEGFISDIHDLLANPPVPEVKEKGTSNETLSEVIRLNLEDLILCKLLSSFKTDDE
jgi:hypothetical protein